MKRFVVVAVTSALLVISTGGIRAIAKPSGREPLSGRGGRQTEQLIAAAQAGGLDQVKAAVAAGANVNARGTYGMTPLMMSTFFGKSDLPAF